MRSERYLRSENFILLIAICAFGLFYEGVAGLVSVGIAILLLLRIKKEGTLKIPKSLILLLFISMPLLAIVTMLWAVDYGEALLSAAKFSVLSLFILYTYGFDKTRKEETLRIIPIVLSILTVIGMLSYFTPLKEFFYINGRFSGTYQYANGYALILLIAFIILLFGEYKTWVSIGCAASIIAGIILTGCRAVFFLAAFSLIIWVISNIKGKIKGKIPILIGSGSVIALSLILAAVTGNTNFFARFSKFSFTSSSLLARFFHYRDGLLLLGKHPLGLGYKGYLFTQGSVQNGSYSATFVHNEFLQTALDFGIVIGILMVIGYFMILLKKGIALRNRLIFFVVGAHAIFDWSLQFPATLMVLSLMIESDSWDITIAKGKKLLVSCALSLSVLLNLYLGIAQVLEIDHQYDKSVKIYPWLTTSQMHIINMTEDKNIRFQTAANIVERNIYCTVALQALAEYCATVGDFDNMEHYAYQSVLSSKYNDTGYEFYLYCMNYAIQQMKMQGNNEKIYEYLTDVANMGSLIDEVNTSTSEYAKYLNSNSVVEVSDEYEMLIKQAENLIS